MAGPSNENTPDNPDEERPAEGSQTPAEDTPQTGDADAEQRLSESVRDALKDLPVEDEPLNPPLRDLLSNYVQEEEERLSEAADELRLPDATKLVRLGEQSGASERDEDSEAQAEPSHSGDDGEASTAQSESADAASESSDTAKEYTDTASASESSDTSATGSDRTDAVTDADGPGEAVVAEPGEAALADPGEAALAEPGEEAGPADEPADAPEPRHSGRTFDLMAMPALIVGAPDPRDDVVVKPAFEDEELVVSRDMIDPDKFENSRELTWEVNRRAEEDDQYHPDRLPMIPGEDGPESPADGSPVDDVPDFQDALKRVKEILEELRSEGRGVVFPEQLSEEQGEELGRALSEGDFPWFKPAEDDGPAKSPADDGPTDEVAEEPAESPSEQPGDDPTADGPAGDGPADDGPSDGPEEEGPAAAPASEPDPTTGPDSSGPGEAAVPEPSPEGPASTVDDEEPGEIAQPSEQDGPGDDAVESDSLIDVLFVPEVPVHLPEEPSDAPAEEPASRATDDAPTQELEVIVDLFGGTVEQSPGAMKMLPEDDDTFEVAPIDDGPRTPEPGDFPPPGGDERW